MRTLYSIAVRLAALALLVAAPAPAQQVVRFNGVSLTAPMILPVDWEGRPGFLLVGVGRGAFAWYQTFSMGKPLPGVPWFRVVAGYFEDRRPCAPGSPVFVSLEDFGPGQKLGEIGANGVLAWTGSPGALVSSNAPRMSTDGWFANYCNDWCHGKCSPGYLDGPQFSALVLVMD